ncbi:2Fe-2S iron-sulfur cluster-binding protein [Lacisediminimonas profundi]|uniref:2Fe-2S iron-sulfur cluster-binding protein n=1 Tax=Lacisediminimonas profundi TaxID=2603856 RepID=UPI00124BA8B5|nr:2Fe-2S iron-sulfur cluster-binding protein [Lacisediminimonas profundi]
MSYQVQLESGESFTVNSDETVLQAALRADLNLPHDCTMGGCGTCRIRLLQGNVAYEEQPFGLTPEEEAEGYALACQARPQSDLVIAPGRTADALPEVQRTSASIKAITAVTDSVLHLVLETPEPVPFLPGQYMNVHLGDGSTRSFSMASAPDGRQLDFHVKRVPGGQFTESQLSQAQPGQTLDVELPLGSFHLHREDYRPLLMVATGTGIAPIRAILQSLLDDPDCPPVWLYWGMRSEAELWLADELASWRERLYEFQFVPVLSRAGAQWQGRRGHVQDAIAMDFDDLSEHAIYLCGAPEMVHQAKSAFIVRGASIDHLYADTFNFAHQLEPVEQEQAA